MERRKHPRTRTSVPVSIVTDETSSVRPGVAVNMSANGAFIEITGHVPGRFEHVRLEFSLPDHGLLRCKGVIARHGFSPEGKAGLAVQLALSVAQEDLLKR